MNPRTEGRRGKNTPRTLPAPGGWTGWALRAAMVCVTTAVAVGAVPASARPSDGGGKKSFTCFQANIYIGGEILGALALDPTDPDYLLKLLQTTTETYWQILASDPPARMAALAREIAASRPDLVGLEEVCRLEQAPATDQGPGEFTLLFDSLELLTETLADLGAHCQVAVVAPETDVIVPFLDVFTQQLMFARVLDREVILVRSDLPPGYLRVTNPRSGRFVTHFEIPLFGLSVDRGWCSVDVFSRGEQFRFLCTHLEDVIAIPIQVTQGQELLAGPANVNMPVVIAGDLNADPLHRNGSPTYDLFLQAGFQDAWLTLNPGDPAGGLTWGHDPALDDPGTEFVWRLDLVLYRAPGFVPTTVEILDPALDRPEPPLWPSDHAAVVASFKLVNPRALMAKSRVERLRAR